jgi:hypothetical protein
MEMQADTSSASPRHGNNGQPQLHKYLWQYIAAFMHDGDEEKEEGGGGGGAAAAAADAGGAAAAALFSTTATATRRHQRCHDDWSFVATFSQRPLRWNCWIPQNLEVAFLSQSAKMYHEFLCSSASSSTEREPSISPSFVGIPRIIHHIWLGSPLPAHFQKLRMTWIHHHPEERGNVPCAVCIDVCINLFVHSCIDAKTSAWILQSLSF